MNNDGYSDLWGSLLDDDDDEVKREMIKLVKKYGKKAWVCLSKIQEAGGLEKFFKIAWHEKEQETDIFTFKECIEWVKAYYDKSNHHGAIVAKKQLGNTLILKIFFAGKDGRPLPDEESHYLIVHCNNIDKSFINQFGDKDILFLK